MCKVSFITLVMFILNYSCSNKATEGTTLDSENLKSTIDTLKLNFDRGRIDTIDLMKYQTEVDSIKIILKNDGEHTAEIKLVHQERCIQISKDSIVKNEVVEIKINTSPHGDVKKAFHPGQLILTTTKYKTSRFLQMVYTNSSIDEKETVSLLFDSELHDFGKIEKEEEKITCGFTFKNVSAHDIKFTKCIASHGIATCNLRELIPPNKIDSIGFEMFVKGKRGKFTKRLSLKGYLDKCPRIYFEKYLTIKGEIITK